MRFDVHDIHSHAGTVAFDRSIQEFAHTFIRFTAVRPSSALRRGSGNAGKQLP